MKSRIKKIIYFIESQFNSFDFERHGIDLLRNNGFEVEVWDFSPFLHPEVYEKTGVNVDEILYQKYNCKLFYTKKEAKMEISKLGEDCFVVCLLIYRFEVFSIYKSITKQKLDYSVIAANTLPLKSRIEEQSKFRKFSIVLSKVKRFTIKKLVMFAVNKISMNYCKIKPATFIMAGGLKSLSYYSYPKGKSTELLWMHTLDYDRFLNDISSNEIKDEGYGVFLDEYLPFHRDFFYLNLKPYTTEQEYYPLVRNFLDALENKYKVEIIIAAHPRSEYEKYPGIFRNRKIIKFKTNELIRNSKFAIMHCSASINFAILYRKPVIFVTDNQLEKCSFGSAIKNAAALLGKQPINISITTDIDMERELTINESAYDTYRNDYIKRDGSLKLPFWQILADKVKSL